MSTTPIAHLNFAGQAREALEYYAAAFGGLTIVRTYGDFGMPAELPDAGKIVFGQVITESGFSVMAYDVPGAETSPNADGFTRRENNVTLTDRSFFLALQAATFEEVNESWVALADGSEIVEPLASTAWSRGFGMLTDRFGVTWVMSVVDPPQD